MLMVSLTYLKLVFKAQLRLDTEVTLIWIYILKGINWNGLKCLGPGLKHTAEMFSQQISSKNFILEKKW